MLRGGKPEIGHQLTRVVETMEIPDLGDHRDGHD